MTQRERARNLLVHASELAQQVDAQTRIPERVLTLARIVSMSAEALVLLRGLDRAEKMTDHARESILWALGQAVASTRGWSVDPQFRPAEVPVEEIRPEERDEFDEAWKEFKP